MSQTSFDTAIIPVPTPVVTHSARAAATEPVASESQSRDREDPWDAFFGHPSYMSTGTRTHDSRHDDGRRQSLAGGTAASVVDVPPPAYGEEAAISLPEYTLHAPEPVTLAMYLFKFGFLFPLFWLFGAFILLTPLREPPQNSDSSIPSWMPEKTEEERRQLIAHIRQVELKWAWRCLWAFLIVVTLTSTAIAIASHVLRR